jgi:hypothetical protein
MSPSIVIRLAMAALATVFVLPAQSAPSRATKPAQAQGEAKADEKVQTRLAEVIAMLEEDDLSPEQRAEAKKKLKEIVDRLRKDAVAKGKEAALLPKAEGLEVIGDGDHVIVHSKEGVYFVKPKLEPARAVEGFPAVIGEPVEGRRVMGLAPETVAPAAPNPPRAPKAPRPPKPPKFPSPIEVPAAPDAPPVPDLADPVAPMSVEGMPLPKPRPRVTRTRVVETHEQPVEAVEGFPVEVQFEAPAELRWAEAKGALEEARAEAEVEGRRLKLKYRALDEARARLDEARQSELEASVRHRADAVRAKVEAERAQLQERSKQTRDKAAEVRRDADKLRAARAEALPRLRELPLLSRSLDREATEEAKSVFGRVAETRPAEAGDEEVRALIDEMRAEMRQIRALMQELRTRSDRDEDDDSERKEVGVRAGSSPAAERQVVNVVRGRVETTVVAPLERTIEVEGQQIEGSAATTEAAPRRVRVVRRAEGQSTGSGASAGSSGTSSGSGPSSSTTSASSSGGR